MADSSIVSELNKEISDLTSMGLACFTILLYVIIQLGRFHPVQFRGVLGLCCILSVVFSTIASIGLLQGTVLS